MEKKMQNGQAMLLATLTLGGAMLGATAIAGLLMLYQIRAATDMESSAKAVFAADAGVEWAEFDFYCDATSTADPNSRCITASPREQALPVFSPAVGAAVSVTCADDTGSSTLCSTTSGAAAAASAVSKGSAGGGFNTSRVFLLNLTGATATLP